MEKSGEELFIWSWETFVRDYRVVFRLKTLFTRNVQHFSSIQIAESVRHLVVLGDAISGVFSYDVHAAWTM